MARVHDVQLSIYRADFLTNLADILTNHADIMLNHADFLIYSIFWEATSAAAQGNKAAEAYQRRRAWSQ